MGVQGASVTVQQHAQPGEAGLGVRVGLKVSAVAMSRRLGKNIVHAARTHVDVPLVGMKGIPGIPVDAVQP